MTPLDDDGSSERARAVLPAAVADRVAQASTDGMEGYTKPADGSDAQVQEWARYNDFESEVGALLRENSYWVASRDLDGDGTIGADEENPLGAPLDLLEMVLSDMSTNWEPSILEANVTGLYRRFQADPRVGDEALAAFVAAAQSGLGVTL